MKVKTIMELILKTILKILFLSSKNKNIKFENAQIIISTFIIFFIFKIYYFLKFNLY